MYEKRYDWVYCCTVDIDLAVENVRERACREATASSLIRRNRRVCLKADGCSDVRDSRLTGAFKHLLLMPLVREYRVLGRVINERVICPSSFACREPRDASETVRAGNFSFPFVFFHRATSAELSCIAVCCNMRVAESARSGNFERHRQRRKMTLERGIESSRWRDGYFNVLLALDGWPVVGNLRLIETFKPSRSGVELLPPLISSQCDVSSPFAYVCHFHVK